MSQIIPPLIVYFNSPQSINNTSNATGALNNSFFNKFNSSYSIATQIAINTPSNSFNKDIYAQTYNGQAPLFLNKDNNDNLSVPIGNFLIKNISLKIKATSSIYSNNSFNILYIYDSNNFIYGNIVCVLNKNCTVFPNSNGFSPDGTYNFEVVYADGYYSYLVSNLNSSTNNITTNIINGVRHCNIPPDPTGKYQPNSNNKFTYFDAFYYGKFNTTFQNSDVIPIQDFNLVTKTYLDSSLKIPCGNALFQNCVTNNLNFSGNYDRFGIQCFSIQPSFGLSLSGNIIGVSIVPNVTINSNGSLGRVNLLQNNVIIYADGDFSYLNEITTPYTYLQSFNQETQVRTISLPVKPSNYVTPTLFNLPNQFINNEWTWNDFYVGKMNNSVIYDSNLQVQNYTLATSEIYDSYDFDNKVPGNIIGAAVSYTSVTKTSSSTQLHFTFTRYVFYNGTILFTCFASTVSLSKIGLLPNNFIVFPNVYSSSDNYSNNNNVIYNTKLSVGAIVDRIQTQYILL